MGRTCERRRLRPWSDGHRRETLSLWTSGRSNFPDDTCSGREETTGPQRPREFDRAAHYCSCALRNLQRTLSRTHLSTFLFLRLFLTDLTSPGAVGLYLKLIFLFALVSRLRSLMMLASRNLKMCPPARCLIVALLRSGATNVATPAYQRA